MRYNSQCILVFSSTTIIPKKRAYARFCVIETIFKNYLFVTAPYSPNEIPINLAFLTTSPAGSTYFNFTAVSSKGIAFTSVLTRNINFP